MTLDIWIMYENIVKWSLWITITNSVIQEIFIETKKTDINKFKKLAVSSFETVNKCGMQTGISSIKVDISKCNFFMNCGLF